MRVAVTVLSSIIGAGVGVYTPQITQKVCGIAIRDRPAHYLVITAIASGLTGWALGAQWLLVAWLWVAISGAVLSFVDIEHHRLPDRLVLPSYLVVAVALLFPAIAYGQWDQYLRAWIGALAMFAVYFGQALIFPAGMGMGDAKLAGVLGLALGYLGWPYVFIGYATTFGVALIVQLGLRAFGKIGPKTAIPFGPFMVVGALTSLLITGPLILGLASA